MLAMGREPTTLELETDGVVLGRPKKPRISLPDVLVGAFVDFAEGAISGSSPCVRWLGCSGNDVTVLLGSLL